MEKTVIAYYSATGNTLSLAKRFENAELVDIIRINEGNAVLSDDISRLGIFFPVYMGGVPYPVREFIKNTLGERDNSELKYVFSLITCGSGGKCAEWMIDRALQDIGIGLSYTLSIRYPDTYLPLVKKVPDEDTTKEILEKSEERIQKAIRDIEKEEIRLSSKPVMGKMMVKIISKTGPDKKDKNMIVSNKCIRCGTCVSICPSNNITLSDDKAIIGDKCLHCYSCYSRCPEEAITYEGRTGHYKGLVTTEELKRR
ncbi:MAG: EFR1 family ferrodoxin [Candidatus Ornithospirochaeta sp.]